MAKTGRAVAKLIEKDKRRAMRAALGTYQPLATRQMNKSTFAQKAVAYLAHQRAIHGYEVDGVTIIEGGRNPGPALEGKGVPDETVRQPKSMADRAAEDKRHPLKDEMVEGWKPARFQPRFARWISTK